PRPLLQQPPPLYAGDTTNIQRGNLFHLPSIAPRPRHGLLPQFGLPGELDTPLRGTMSRPHERDGSDYAYSCRALRRRARIQECGGRQGCRTCIGVRDQSHKWLRQWSREEVGVSPRSRAPPVQFVAVSPSWLVDAGVVLALRLALPVSSLKLKAQQNIYPKKQHS